MKIDQETVEKIAHLARLDVSEEEKEAFANQLSDILEHAEKLNELDTENVEPTAHALPIKNVFRKDEVRESLEREDALANAPAKDQGMFKVPQIVE
ncbi:Asp-tRNA(Asn)/Glu-tRNA(Gln) amidotransferase subunit GatC [Natroniella sulfidigena]|uniref:Asp-tRNA(Asn)/Glu-tRNA(Gln) amidotransferase subunit GatC n=1 Tax=Natroniella sulfidigena TaxID=723921 RepID=UPI00200AA276|nr:Asp-tRNA(Asn)/Glu-tRNA(Gln) amidotransferase subunit GatC [Natroniella sulfidigena]MCK8816063.1 Asp-tRNA(Asn)/Glu-tRNA(Gln) amidotransferase subunit GatC [Natroniella sulfidigena]